MGNTCSEMVANEPDNVITTGFLFVFAAVAVVNAWAFRYIPKENNKRKKTVKSTTGDLFGSEGIGFFTNTFAWAVAYVFFCGAGFWFLFSVHNQCKWAFFLFVSLFGLSAILDKFCWPYFYFNGNKNAGMFFYAAGWLAELGIIITWPIANFGGVAVHTDGTWGGFNLAFGIVGEVLFFLWLAVRGYVLWNMWNYNEPTGAFKPLIG
jgi:hypothetical protein